MSRSVQLGTPVPEHDWKTVSITVTREPNLSKVRFTLPSAIGDVSVVGTFNDWTPNMNPLVRRSNGRRSVIVALAGDVEEIRFRYLTRDGHWFDDEDAERCPEGGLIVLEKMP